MKRFLILALLLSSLFSGAQLVFAQTTCLDTGCSGDQVCKGSPPTCQANAAACTPACTGNTPVCVNGTCQAASQYTNGQTTSSSGSGQTFVSLSNIPALGTGAGAAPSLPYFLNGLYTICIGIAIVLAILQLVRGGITYMLGESMGTLEEAKHLILVSLLGLVLVLSPYIVFSIINPAILQFNLSNDVSGLTSGLQSTTGTPAGAATGPGSTGTGSSGGGSNSSQSGTQTQSSNNSGGGW